ncbi:MAG: hypothetical protein ACFFDF_24880 [Candidatus Odinarchaeota archaeon]
MVNNLQDLTTAELLIKYNTNQEKILSICEEKEKIENELKDRGLNSRGKGEK